jgi:CRISPR system Cascade subunit CasE
MFLSELVLDRENPRVRRETSDLLRMYGSIRQAFAEGKPQIRYRLEEQPGLGRALTLVVQSAERPDWAWLTREDARGYLLTGRHPNPKVVERTVTFGSNRKLAFRVRAHPALGRVGETGSRGDEQAWLGWLDRQGERGGFRVFSARVTHQTELCGRMRTEAGRQELSLLAVQFDGTLVVKNEGLLELAVARGLGGGRPLGLGLLSLRLQVV